MRNENSLTIEENKSNKKPKKDSFSKYIKKIRNRRGISTKKLAEKLDISYEMLRKRINHEKPIKNRDFIIAIGFALNMTPSEINEAIRLYQYNADNYMNKLSDDDPRDNIIIYDAKNKDSIYNLNRDLEQEGFPKLNINNKIAKNTKVLPNPNYKKICGPIIKINIQEGDPYNSLSTEYNPSNNYIFGYMWLENKKAKNLRLRDTLWVKT